MRAVVAVAIAVPILWASARVFAHGNVPAPATFTSPPKLTATPTDGGDRAFSPYAFPIVDGSFDVAWDDGDTDPISEHFFYYMDHAPPLALAVGDVMAQATPIPEGAGGIWAACSCPADFGMCPDIGTRDCRNGFTWDTSALPAGTYWLIAITHDPPYDVYTVSDGPIRVAHGGAASPPAIIVVKPDGFGTYDQTYAVRWMLAGTDPMHVTLEYESDDDVRANAPWKPLGMDVPLVAGPDGTYAFTWDTSLLQSARIFHVRATVSDGSGQTTFSESRAGVTIFHPGDNPDVALPSVDASVDPKVQDGGCRVASPRVPTPGFVLALALVVIAAGLLRRSRS